tara:strand:- start:972 stop:1136 length:165 start_codon:yes stop_codon:yes gene_type:complete
MLRGGWVIQEGTAVGFLLVWCGRSATTLVAAGHNLNKLWGIYVLADMDIAINVD